MNYILLLSFTLCCALSLCAQSDKEVTQKTVTKAKTEGRIYFLAGDLLKGRETGTMKN